jgi:hypothetical protein
LVRAESKKAPAKQGQKSAAFEHGIVNTQKAQYGKMETKRAIQNVLDVVINQYKFSSLPELNAVLKQYNVMADRGQKTPSLTRKKVFITGSLMTTEIRSVCPLKQASSIRSQP